MKKELTLILCLLLIVAFIYPARGGDDHLNAMTSEELYEEGLESMDTEAYRLAYSYFERITERKDAPSGIKADAWYKMGICSYYLKGDVSLELEYYNNALALNPSHDKALYAKGWVFYDRGEVDKASECFNKVENIAPEAGYKWYGETDTGVTIEEMKNGTYNIQTRAFPEPVKLTDGKFETTIGGLAAEVAVYDNKMFALGDLNRDGKKEGALILVCTTGGSGSFRMLALVMEKDGNPSHIASEFLGDRVVIESLEISNEKIIINMISHGSGDGANTPSVKSKVSYELEGEELVEVEE